MAGIIRGFATKAAEKAPDLLKSVCDKTAKLTEHFVSKAPYLNSEGQAIGKVYTTSTGRKITIINDDEVKRLAHANFARKLQELQEKKS